MCKPCTIPVNSSTKLSLSPGPLRFLQVVHWQGKNQPRSQGLSPAGGGMKRDLGDEVEEELDSGTPRTFDVSRTFFLFPALLVSKSTHN